MRDESHRCAITHHRAVRSKHFTQSTLEEIPGIGPARRKALLKHFQSLKAIKAASLEELLAVDGMTKNAAEAVLAWAQQGKKK